MTEGSPLRVWTERQAKLLAGYLGERDHAVLVRPAMRYGEPAVARVLDELKALGASHVLVLPLYPQYAAATTASVFDAVHRWASRTRSLPELRFVNGYADDSGYIKALEQRVRDHWVREGRGEKLVLSFHGLPERAVKLGDPYHNQCLSHCAVAGRAPGARIRAACSSPSRADSAKRSGWSPQPSRVCAGWPPKA